MTVHGVPRLPPGLVPRKRITDRLDADTAIVVAVAPSGFGKTVALTQWAAGTSRDGLWLRIREGMSEPNGFVLQLGLALREFGIIDESNPLWNPADAVAGAHDSWSLALRGLRTLGRDLTLLIDDGERLDDDSAAGLVDLVADLPNLSLRVATRTGSAFTTPDAVSRVGVDVIRQDDLALTPDEIDAILPPSTAEDEVQSIARHGGSPALARLVVLGATQAESGWSLSDAVDALLRRQSARWDAAFADFVMRTSLADALDAELARDLTGREDAGALLDRAEREGLGYWSGLRSGARGRFVYTPFLREAVERHARATLPPSDLRALVLRVARWELAKGYPLAGLALAVEQDDWDLADEIIRGSWIELLRTGEELRKVFRGVPLTRLGNRPLPAALLAISYNGTASSRLRALEYFALTIVAARRTRATVSVVDRTILRLVESVAYRVSSRLESAGAVAGAGLNALHDLPLEARQELGDNEITIFSQFGISLLYSGDTAAAITSFSHAVSAGRARGSGKALHPLILQAGTMALRGDLPEAARLLREAEGFRWPEGWREGYQGTFLHLARAWEALEAGDPAAAEEHVRQVDGTLPANEHWPLVAHVEALSLVLRGRADEAAARLDSIIRTQRARRAYPPLTADRLRGTRALIELARGDAGAASRVLARAKNRAETTASHARVALVENDPGRALRELGRDLPADASARRRAEHAALKAAAVAMLQPGPEALSAIRRLYALLVDRGLTLPLVFVPVAGIDAMRAVADGAGDDRVRGLLEAARARAPLTGGQTRPRLSERERAVARQLVAGGTVEAIATALNVSPNTVKSQMRSIYRKLDVRTRTEAIRSLSTLDLTE
ncbi:LuxR C-terminal-related transcriptional regulator [Microbacterium sp. Marseille-Q6965]|uniref:LuxR C-terminal-related transcriptional regulator n=1 Tax=Microbacterium sp. Marseille-Q6965 TaxID=2965072 RepID=UPI0021B7DBA3|nr:LuxR C-terminal-related transcriptional regulator [Microbacterium sp. Marseille-Q6965]